MYYDYRYLDFLTDVCNREMERERGFQKGERMRKEKSTLQLDWLCGWIGPFGRYKFRAAH
jgi:hypothetical protein